MRRTLLELSASLSRLNIPLRIVRADTARHIPDVLLRLARETQCDSLYLNREYELNESRRDELVSGAFRQAGLSVRAFDDQVFATPGEVRTGEGRYFTVFTPFKKALYARMGRMGVPEEAPGPRRQPSMAADPDPIPAQFDGIRSPVEPDRWPAGELHARRRLDAFLDGHARAYKDRRDLPADDGTSSLSPYLAIGAISARQCLNAALNADGSHAPLGEGNPGIATWISELVWREFYIHIMVGFPRVCMNRAFQPATERIRWNDNPDWFLAWSRGGTGVPIVDAGMRQLAQMGWMHNRVRMITAMYFTKNLFLDWRLGESWFMRNLVDGFLASNNGGWQWSASTGTDAAPYFRIFNPVSQSRTFDPDGVYIRRFVPELASIGTDALHEPWSLPPLARASLDYPEPLVDLAASRAAAIAAFRKLKGSSIVTRPFDDVAPPAPRSTKAQPR